MDDIVYMLKKDLADNYHDKDEDVIETLVNNYLLIASSASNRDINDKKLIPFVYTAVKAAYLKRGDEGTLSSNEGGLSSSYIDIEEKLRKDVITIRLGAF